MQKHTLKTTKRELTGRKVKRLRAEGIVPGTLFGKGLISQNVQVTQDELLRVYSKAGETGVVELELGPKKHPVLITNIQVHAATGQVLHVDFREVDLTQKIKAMVPVELVGESPAEKQGLGTAVLLMDELEVEALPTDLPEKFEIDATKLVEVEQTFAVSDLVFDKKVAILTPSTEILAKVEPPQKEEVVEAPVAPAEGEAPVAPADGVEVKEETPTSTSTEEKKE